MIGFGRRSRPNVTARSTAGDATDGGVGIAAEGPVDFDGGMAADWGEGGGRVARATWKRRQCPATPNPECSGFSGHPKVVSVFAVPLEIGD